MLRPWRRRRRSRREARPPRRRDRSHRRRRSRRRRRIFFLSSAAAPSPLPLRPRLLLLRVHLLRPLPVRAAASSPPTTRAAPASRPSTSRPWSSAWWARPTAPCRSTACSARRPGSAARCGRARRSRRSWRCAAGPAPGEKGEGAAAEGSKSSPSASRQTTAGDHGHVQRGRRRRPALALLARAARRRRAAGPVGARVLHREQPGARDPSRACRLTTWRRSRPERTSTRCSAFASRSRGCSPG